MSLQVTSHSQNGNPHEFIQVEALTLAVSQSDQFLPAKQGSVSNKSNIRLPEHMEQEMSNLPASLLYSDLSRLSWQ